MWKLIKTAFWLGLLVAIVYCGIQLFRPYYKHYTLESEVEQMVRFPLNSEEELKVQILKRAEELKIPLNPSQIEVDGKSGFFHVTGSWSEQVNLFNQYKRTFHFTIDSGRR